MFLSPEVSNNVVSQNKVSGNGLNPCRSRSPSSRGHHVLRVRGLLGNCFQKNKPRAFVRLLRANGLLPPTAQESLTQLTSA